MSLLNTNQPSLLRRIHWNDLKPSVQDGITALGYYACNDSSSNMFPLIDLLCLSDGRLGLGLYTYDDCDDIVFMKDNKEVTVQADPESNTSTMILPLGWMWDEDADLYLVDRARVSWTEKDSWHMEVNI